MLPTASSSTPRKKQVIGETGSSRKGKSRGTPTPNPPLVPFPTPPSTRHRKRPLPFDDSIPPQPDFASGASLFAPPRLGEPAKGKALPTHLQTLLTLHKAFNLALSLHIATKPPILPPHPADSTKIALPNLTTFLALKETVERTGGRRFGQAEFGRLAWLWTWDGLPLSDEKSSSETISKEEDNPFLVGSSVGKQVDEVAGLSYLITTTRTVDGHGRRVYTHGIGIELDLKPHETRSLALLEGDVGPSKGQGGGMGAVGRWNGAGQDREDAVREKLEKWVEMHGGYEESIKFEHGLPTPSDSRGESRSSIPPIPLKALPHIPSSSGLASANLFSAVMSGPAGLSTPPKKPISSTVPSTTGPPGLGGLDDPFVLDETKDAKKPGKGVEARRQAMLDRIKARSGGSKAPLATLGSAVTHRKLPLTGSEQQEALKRRSTLSRLEGVAEGVWMMFSSSPPGPSSMPTPPRGKRKAIPMSEAAELIVKSSKTPISTAEAQTSLQMLSTLCPFFLVIKTVAKQDWISLGSGAAPPPSPGKDALPEIISSLPPSFATPASPSSSPRAAGGSPRVGLLSSPIIASPGRSPVTGAGRFEKVNYPVLSGPASPGRVRRGGGLREVREKIRRELERI